MKKLLLLGSVVSSCPPKKQGGTERVAYVQAKQLAKHGVDLIFVGAHGTKQNFEEQLLLDGEVGSESLLSKIEFVEIGGGTGFGSQEDSLKYDKTLVEASRNLRLEMVNLAQVQSLMIERKADYKVILNNMRGESIFLPLAKILEKEVISVMHLNIFEELADLFEKFDTKIVTIADHQKSSFPNLNYLATISNPVNADAFKFSGEPKNYALFISTVGTHKNQKDAILACKKASIPLIMGGKIRDVEYFEKEIKPLIDGKNVIYAGELSFNEKLKLYQEAKVFLFPILWQEPFGLVVIEALSCGTPVIAYPNGGPSEIIKDGVNGFLVNSADEMADKIKLIDEISRKTCRAAAEERFGESAIGQRYFEAISTLL